MSSPKRHVFLSLLFILKCFSKVFIIKCNLVKLSLNMIIFTNKKLHRFKLADSPLCAFCNAEKESLEHLLYFCKSSSFFWKELLSWIAVDANIVLNTSLLDILFGKFHLEKDFLLVNHIFLLAKYFIYKCKLHKVIPSLLVFKAKLKAT